MELANVQWKIYTRGGGVMVSKHSYYCTRDAMDIFYIHSL